MSRIYSQAYSVCIWLGGEDAYSQRAAETMTRITVDRNKKESPPAKWQELQMYDIRDLNAYQKLGLPYTSVDEWLKFYAFINRSWFKRSWIVQEASLAQRMFVLCGLWNMDIDVVFNAISFVSGSSWLHQIKMLAEGKIQGYPEPGYQDTVFHTNAGTGTEGSAEESLYRPRPLPPYNQNIFIDVMTTHLVVTGRDPNSGFKLLGTVLEQYRGTMAGDPRDKVYAFLGMAKEFQGNVSSSALPGFTPDYTKSVTDVYIDAMKHILSSSENLLFLGLKEPRADSPINDLPS